MLFSFDLDDLIKDEVLEAIWCKIKCEASGINEEFIKVLPQDIDTSPLPWHKCESFKGLLYGAIRHYLIVLKDGFIDPKYLEIEHI